MSPAPKKSAVWSPSAPRKNESTRSCSTAAATSTMAVSKRWPMPRAKQDWSSNGNTPSKAHRIEQSESQRAGGFDQPRDEGCQRRQEFELLGARDRKSTRLNSSHI